MSEQFKDPQKNKIETPQEIAEKKIDNAMLIAANCFANNLHALVLNVIDVIITLDKNFDPIPVMQAYGLIDERTPDQQQPIKTGLGVGQ